MTDKAEADALDNWAAGWLERLGAPADFESAIAEKVKTGVPYADASAEAARERPDLYEKYRADVRKAQSCQG
ncbi:hypothetical protein [Micromonospora sp. NPDC047187]|uniref:hypothetical protein n=1 Tax=Micromonospora sp. NPDC047187 TaxID=3155262 RepID=UPI0033E60344